MTLLTKNTITDVTFVRLLTSVCFQVAFKRTVVAELFHANLTPIWLLSGMDALVYLQIITRLELFLTRVTFEKFIHRMDFEMDLQMFNTVELFIAE